MVTVVVLLLLGVGSLAMGILTLARPFPDRFLASKPQHMTEDQLKSVVRWRAYGGIGLGLIILITFVFYMLR